MNWCPADSKQDNNCDHHFNCLKIKLNKITKIIINLIHTFIVDWLLWSQLCLIVTVSPWQSVDSDDDKSLMGIRLVILYPIKEYTNDRTIIGHKNVKRNKNNVYIWAPIRLSPQSSLQSKYDWFPYLNGTTYVLSNCGNENMIPINHNIINDSLECRLMNVDGWSGLTMAKYLFDIKIRFYLPSKLLTNFY